MRADFSAAMLPHAATFFFFFFHFFSLHTRCRYAAVIGAFAARGDAATLYVAFDALSIAIRHATHTTHYFYGALRRFAAICRLSRCCFDDSAATLFSPRCHAAFRSCLLLRYAAISLTRRLFSHTPPSCFSIRYDAASHVDRCCVKCRAVMLLRHLLIFHDAMPLLLLRYFITPLRAAGSAAGRHTLYATTLPCRYDYAAADTPYDAAAMIRCAAILLQRAADTTIRRHAEFHLRFAIFFTPYYDAAMPPYAPRLLSPLRPLFRH